MRIVDQNGRIGVFADGQQIQKGDRQIEVIDVRNPFQEVGVFPAVDDAENNAVFDAGKIREIGHIGGLAGACVLILFQNMVYNFFLNSS